MIDSNFFLQIWLLIATVITINAHCGYHYTDCLFHDFHHEKTKYNFGVLGALDWFHGTDSSFYKKIGGQSSWGKLFAQAAVIKLEK